jgi:hypothetical protein
MSLIVALCSSQPAMAVIAAGGAAILLAVPVP